MNSIALIEIHDEWPRQSGFLLRRAQAEGRCPCPDVLFVPGTGRLVEVNHSGAELAHGDTGGAARDLCGDGLHTFPIQARQLLRLGDDAHLAYGRVLGGPANGSHVDRRLARGLEQRVTRGVLTDDAAQADLCPEDRQALGNVGRAAQAVEGPVSLDDRHGRLGRNAGDRAVDVFVEHEITGDPNPRAPKTLQYRFDFGSTLSFSQLASAAPACTVATSISLANACRHSS